MVAQALWQLVLAGGAEVPVLVRHDFVLTNASLTEDIVDVNDRSVVKVAFEPRNPAELKGDDEDEDDMSDDEDGLDLEGLDPEDLESDDDDDEAVKEFKQEMRAKIVAIAEKGEKPNEASAAGVTTEDDEDEDEDEDDEDFSLSEEPVDMAVCALTPGKIEQVQLNLTFNEEEVVMFKNTGKNTIHLLGNYIDQFPFNNGHDDYDSMPSDSEYDSEGYPIGMDSEDESEDDMEDSDVDMADLEKVVGRKGKTDSSRFEEINEAPKKKETKKAITAAPTAAATPESKKRKAEEPASAEKPAAKKADKKQKVEAATPAPAAATEKKDKKKDTPAAASKPEQQGSKKRTLANGLVIEDVKIGDGAVAKKGKRCGMRYIGKLLNGKQFDANTAGSPFNFRLGAGEVIKGWDQGVAGMAVGGERKLTIPAALAYGSQKIPGIPPNSTLSFDIKLVNVK